MSAEQIDVRASTEEEFFWFVENLHSFWPENSEHVRSFLDPFWFYEFGDGMLTAQHVNNGLVGFVLVVKAQRVLHRAYVILVATHVGWRRKGVGRRLYQSAFSDLRTDGVRDVVTAVRPSNLQSLLFHERVGFHYIDRGRQCIDLNGRPAVLDYRGKEQHRFVLQKCI